MFPRLITIGPVTLHTYGLLAALGLLVAIFTAVRLAPRAGLDRQKIYNLGVYTALAGLLGGKVMLFLIDWQYYSAHPRELFSLRSLQAGGMYYGGILFGLLVVWLYSRSRQLGFARVADVFAPGVALGTAVGRIGCFAAGCCWGKATNLAWAVTFTDPYAYRIVGVPLHTPLHPTQLYEAAVLSLIAGSLFWLWRRRAFEGQIFAAFLLLYGFARFWLEFLRGDPRGTVLGGQLSVPQALSIVLVLAGAVYFWHQRRRTRGTHGG